MQEIENLSCPVPSQCMRACKVRDKGLVFVLCRAILFTYITPRVHDEMIIAIGIILWRKMKSTSTFWTGRRNKVKKFCYHIFKEFWFGSLFSHRKHFSISWEHNGNDFPKYLQLFFNSSIIIWYRKLIFLKTYTIFLWLLNC